MVSLLSSNVFRHRAWISTAAYWLGLLSIVLSIATGNLLYWWPYIILLYIVGSITISVGYHRLFCHNSFKTNKFWHLYFAVTGVLYLYSSPLQWAATHSTHHKHSDTSKDPHPQGWRAIVFKGYRNVSISTYRIRRLLRQQTFHKWLDQYYMLWYVCILAVLLFTVPEFVMWCYLPALGLAHFVGGLHNLISHKNNKPQNLWLLEYIMPASGEWLHLNHHNRPGLFNFKSRWYHFDLGTIIVSIIKTRRPAWL